MAQSKRQQEKDVVNKPVPARTLQPKPGMWSKVESGQFLTTDPGIVERLFTLGFQATCRRGTEVVYVYPASKTAEIQTALKQRTEDA